MECGTLRRVFVSPIRILKIQLEQLNYIFILLIHMLYFDFLMRTTQYSRHLFLELCECRAVRVLRANRSASSCKHILSVFVERWVDIKSFISIGN